MPDSQPDSPLLKWVLSAKTHFSLWYAKRRRSCASPDYITSRQNYAQQRDRTSIWIYTRKTSSTEKSYYCINSWIYIYLTTMNNTSLSSNTKTCPSSSRTHTQLPDCLCHHWRPPPGKAVITHGNSRDSRSNPEPLSTNCFVYNIYPPNPTNIRSIHCNPICPIATYIDWSLVNRKKYTCTQI